MRVYVTNMLIFCLRLQKLHIRKGCLRISNSFQHTNLRKNLIINHVNRRLNRVKLIRLFRESLTYTPLNPNPVFLTWITPHENYGEHFYPLQVKEPFFNKSSWNNHWWTILTILITWPSLPYPMGQEGSRTSSPSRSWNGRSCDGKSCGEWCGSQHPWQATNCRECSREYLQSKRPQWILALNVQ